MGALHSVRNYTNQPQRQPQQYKLRTNKGNRRDAIISFPTFNRENLANLAREVGVGIGQSMPRMNAQRNDDPYTGTANRSTQTRNLRQSAGGMGSSVGVSISTQTDNAVGSLIRSDRPDIVGRYTGSTDNKIDKSSKSSFGISRPTLGIRRDNYGMGAGAGKSDLRGINSFRDDSTQMMGNSNRFVSADGFNTPRPIATDDSGSLSSSVSDFDYPTDVSEFDESYSDDGIGQSDSD